MVILQKSFMLRTPDNLIEKISVQDRVVDCANYISKSGLSFNGCFQMKKGELLAVRGLYKLYNDPIFKFSSRGKITRDLGVMRDLIDRFLREFNVGNALIYYDNYTIRVYDVYRKAVMLEDTPTFSQGHLFVYRLKTPIDFSDAVKVTEEKAFNHKLIFANSVSVLYDTLDDIHISPGYGFIVQKADDDPVRISSPDHGEDEVALTAGQWLFIHSPPRKNID